MLNIIYTEFLKLKRSRVLLLLPIGALLPPLLNFLVYFSNGSSEIMKWQKFFDFTALLMNAIMGIALFSLLAGYQYSREYSENTVNTMFTYPISRLKFFFAKMVIMYAMIIAVLATSFILAVIFGLLLPHEPMDFVCLSQYAVLYFYMALMHLALAPVAMLLGMIGKSVIPPIALGISAAFVNVVILSSKYGPYFPWGIPSVLAAASKKLDRDVFYTSIEILAATFVIGAVLSMIYTVKADVLSKN